MNVLWISPFLLHPTRSGGQIRSLGILRQLHQRNNIHVVAFQLPGQEEGVARMNEYCTSADRIPHILPNGFDVDSFPEVRREPAKSGEIVLGTVGHLRSEKRQDRLIAACAELARSLPVRLIIAGDGPQRPRLEEMARVLGIAGRISFLGHQSDLCSIYKQMDIFALSSATEQMPLAVLEAMACGLPVVSTDVGDVGTMVSRENAPLVTNNGGLVAALHKIAVDPGARVSIGRANRLHCRAYDISKMFARYAVLYESAIKQSNRWFLVRHKAPKEEADVD